jgi:hypothetical protein
LSSTALTVLNNAPQLPADIEAMLDEESNVVARETVPSLSYEGKVWTVSLNGEKTKLIRKNADGDEEPLPIFRGIILDWNKRRGRAFYEGAYDPNKVTMPICWSDDGITPDETVTEKQSPACKTCPKSVKGSKVTEQGKQVTACAEHRMIVLCPAQRMNEDFVLRLKLAPTSDWDGQSPDHEAAGWYGFRNYMDMLQAKGVKHTAQLVTKMRFDPNVAYPKVLFGVDKWNEQDTLRTLLPLSRTEKVKQLGSGTYTPNGADAVPKALPAGQTSPDPAIAEAEAAALHEKALKAKADQEAAEAKVKQEAQAKAKAAAEAKAAQEAAQAAQEAAKAAQVAEPVDDDDMAFPDIGGAPKVEVKATTAKPNGTTKATKPKPKAAAEPAAAPAPVTSDTDINSLLNDWGG